MSNVNVCKMHNVHNEGRNVFAFAASVLPFLNKFRYLHLKLEFHDADTDTDILARILANMSDTLDFLKLFLWQAERHDDILATILAWRSARMSVSVSWNATRTSSPTSWRGSSRGNSVCQT